MSITHPRRAIAIVLAWVLVPFPVLGSLILLLGTSHQLWRSVGTYGGDSWHTFVVVLFAIGLTGSAIINATEVSMSSVLHGGLARRSAYLGWQITTLVVATGWLGCLWVGGDYHVLEFLCGCVLIATSSVTCFYATRE